MVFPDFVEIYGLEDWERSMPALGYFTQFASAEFAVRPFLDRDPERAMVYMDRWSKHENPHVRRLASEGCRPRLPWAMALPKFKEDPRPILPILDRLKDDESESVRRSVANNLNDISKDNPGLVLETCEHWYGRSEQIDWVVKHGCRSLLKAGDTRALRLFGFGDPAQIAVERLHVRETELQIGDALFFAFELKVNGEEEIKLRLEYAINYVKAGGKTSKKIFQISERRYAPSTHKLQRKQSLADMSTRKHYPGKHRLAVIVNGEEKAACFFELLAA
jgi:3-methyladenine DNA glycosylase AlkC